MTNPRPSAVVVGALAALALALGGCASGTPSAPPASSAPAPSGVAAPPEPARDAPVPTSTSAAADPAVQRPLARVFPTVNGSNCRVAAPEDRLRTTQGAEPTEAYLCDFSSVAPGATASFIQWADTAAAQEWYQETVVLGPRLENFDRWTVGGAPQGPLYTAGQSGQVVSTGLYEGLAYSWEIRTSTLDQSNQVYQQLQLQARSAFGS